MQKKLKILAIETFYGGSHQNFIDGLIKHSYHEISLIALSDKHWRWKMKSGVIEIMEKIGRESLKDYDLLFVSSLCNIAELKALIGLDCPPVVLYAHENQHTYPKNAHQKSDFHIEWIDFMNTVSADHVLYNSNSHRTAYHQAVKLFLQNSPEINTSSNHWLNRAEQRSSVIYPGTDTADYPLHSISDAERPRIIWNHRWEYDKQPAHFLKMLNLCMRAGHDFELILLGESPAAPSAKYEEYIEQLQLRIVHRGYVNSRQEYFSLLASGNIVISTAIQENFGLSIVEAIQCGCFPILPNRLSYPELIPLSYHSRVLYDSDDKFYRHLTAVLKNKTFLDKSLSSLLMKHCWNNQIEAYDHFFDGLVKHS